MSNNNSLLYFVFGLISAYSTEIGNGKDHHYFIKNDYSFRDAYLEDDEIASRDECQDEVYKAAFNLTLKEPCQMIADIGCGSGFKLLKYFQNFKTIGFEVEPNYSVLNSRYPDKEWYYGDFQEKFSSHKFDIVICADVIEHLVDPDLLLTWIRELDFKYLVLSTPDRDKLVSIQCTPQTQSGVPVNPHHIREWNFKEFENYIRHYFDVIDHFHPEIESYGQVIIARKKSLE